MCSKYRPPEDGQQVFDPSLHNMESIWRLSLIVQLPVALACLSLSLSHMHIYHYHQLGMEPSRMRLQALSLSNYYITDCNIG